MPTATERVSDRTLTEGTDTWTATIAYDVIEADDEVQALAAVPYTLGATHPMYGSLYVQSRTPAKKGIRYWVVTVNFSTDPAQESDQLSRKAKLKWTPESVSEAVDRDAYGNPLFNSPRDIITGATNEVSVLRLDAVQWAPAFLLRKALNYFDAVNSDQFTVSGLSVEPGECICKAFAPESEYAEDNTQPIPIRYTFLFRALLHGGGATGGQSASAGSFTAAAISAWDWRFLDQGNRAFHSDQTTQTTGRVTGDRSKRAFYIGRDPVPEPVRLDGEGRPIDKNVRLGPEGYEVLHAGAPPGAVIDKRFLPDAAFLIYQKKLRRPFRGLIRYFK